MNFILDLLFPKKCVGCKKLDTLFCQDCIASILQKELICPECEESSMAGEPHPLCSKKYGLDGLWSLGIYKNPLQEAIKQLKYGRIKGLAETLAEITFYYFIKYKPFIWDEIKRNMKEWVIMPVPLHWWRENSRGFNQSNLFGQILSKKLGLAYCNALKRTRYTKSQVGLKKYARQKNIKDAFVLSDSCSLKADGYLLIDDVWTTGSTLKECCYILKKGGAKKVWAITIAR